MSLSWAKIFSTQSKASTNSLPIQCIFTPKNVIKQRRTQSNIPLRVRYEKELASDDDMIITNAEYESNESQMNNNTPKFTLISDEEFILNHYTPTDNILLIQCIIQFLPLQNALTLMKCCNAYTNIFENNDNSLLLVYKQLYHRDFGTLKFKYHKSSNVPKTKQLLNFKQNLQKYSFWKKQYKNKITPDFTWMHSWYICETERHGYNIDSNSFLLSILCNDYDKNDIRMLSNNDMIIVTKHKVHPFQLLDIKHFRKSNWYLKNPRLTWGIRRGGPNRYWLPANSIEHYYYGYKYLEIKNIVRNIDINHEFYDGLYTYLSFSIGYVFVVRYIEREYELKDIRKIDGMDSECCKQKRKCILKATQSEENLMMDEVEVEGVVFNDIMNIKDLEINVGQAKIRRQYVRVVVYVIGLNTSSWDEAEDFEKMENKARYVVMRYA
eukprot:433860_1